jgi:hypothetical protein
VNVIGVIGFLRWLPIMNAFERVAYWIRAVFNDWLSFRAARGGFSHQRLDHLYPVEDTWSLRKFLGSFLVIVICIAAIAIIEEGRG